MYYEVIIHEKIEVNSIEEVSKLLTINKPESYKVINYKDLYFVNDAHIDDPSFSEVAVLRKINEKYYQFESLSGSALFIEELQQMYYNLENYIFTKNVQLLFEKDPKAYGWFTCGCCGCRFYGNVNIQLNYDQDNGYGICDECSTNY